MAHYYVRLGGGGTRSAFHYIGTNQPTQAQQAVYLSLGWSVVNSTTLPMPPSGQIPVVMEAETNPQTGELKLYPLVRQSELVTEEI